MPLGQYYCPAPGCRNSRMRQHAFCPECWKRVPKKIQEGIWATASRDKTAWMKWMFEATAALGTKHDPQFCERCGDSTKDKCQKCGAAICDFCAPDEFNYHELGGG